MSKQNKITNITELKQYAKGSVVELPPFAEDQPFIARVKRPSLLGMVKSGKIPNSLISKTNELFSNAQEAFNPDDDKMMSDMYDVMELIVRETLVEPTYEQIKEAGLELTDDQMMYLFNYGQQGVKALETFRTKSED